MPAILLPTPGAECPGAERRTQLLPVPFLASRVEARNVSRSDRIMIAAGGGALILALAAAWLALAPVEDAPTDFAPGA